MSAEKTIALAAGGTGGHMFPAQALAEEMKKLGWRVLLFTDARGLRYTENFPADKIIELKAATPSARGIGAKVLAVLTLAGSLFQVRKTLKDLRPDIVVGFGGYPSVPTTLAARLCGIPYGLHEQNAVLGRSNRLLAGGAKFIAHAFPRLDKLPKTRGIVKEIGNPVRAAIREEMGHTFANPDRDDTISILVFAGSQGASIFSRIVPEAIAQLPDSLRHRLSVVQQARPDEEMSVRDAYDAAAVDHEVAAFFNDMPDRFTKAHLVISRAGASTVTEIAAMGRPAILVPLGIAMDDHQTVNAEVLVSAGAARLLPESAFSPEKLCHEIVDIFSKPDTITAMAAMAASVAHQDATANLAALVEQTIKAE